MIIEQPFLRHCDLMKDLIPYFEDEDISGSTVAHYFWCIGQHNPSLPQTLATWRETARLRGFNPFIVGCLTFGFDQPTEMGFDAAAEFPPHGTRAPTINEQIPWLAPFHGSAHDYELVVIEQLARVEPHFPIFRSAMVSWDNTARRGTSARIYTNASPPAFEIWLSELVKRAKCRGLASDKLIFVNAWNEWGEGTHLEPDNKFGRAWLEVCLRSICRDGQPADLKELGRLFPKNANARYQLSLLLLRELRIHRGTRRNIRSARAE